MRALYFIPTNALFVWPRRLDATTQRMHDDPAWAATLPMDGAEWGGWTAMWASKYALRIVYERVLHHVFKTKFVLTRSDMTMVLVGGDELVTTKSADGGFTNVGSIGVDSSLLAGILLPALRHAEGERQVARIIALLAVSFCSEEEQTEGEPIVFLSKSRDADAYFHALSAEVGLRLQHPDLEGLFVILHHSGRGSKTRAAEVSTRLQKIGLMELEMAVNGTFDFVTNISGLTDAYVASTALPGRGLAKVMDMVALYATCKNDLVPSWAGLSFHELVLALQSREFRRLSGGEGLVILNEANATAALSCVRWMQLIGTVYARVVGRGLYCNGFWARPWVHFGAVAQLLRSKIVVPSALQCLLRCARIQSVFWLLGPSLWLADPTSHPMFGRRAAGMEALEVVTDSVLHGYRYSTEASSPGKFAVVAVAEVYSLEKGDDVAELVGLGDPKMLAGVTLASLGPVALQFLSVGSKSAAALTVLAAGAEPTVQHLLLYVQDKCGGADAAYTEYLLPPELHVAQYSNAEAVDIVVQSGLAVSAVVSELRRGMRTVGGYRVLKSAETLAELGKGGASLSFATFDVGGIAAAVSLVGAFCSNALCRAGEAKAPSTPAELVVSDLTLALSSESVPAAAAWVIATYAALLKHLVACRACAGGSKEGGGGSGGSSSGAAAERDAPPQPKRTRRSSRQSSLTAPAAAPAKTTSPRRKRRGSAKNSKPTLRAMSVSPKKERASPPSGAASAEMSEEEEEPPPVLASTVLECCTKAEEAEYIRVSRPRNRLAVRFRPTVLDPQYEWGDARSICAGYVTGSAMHAHAILVNAFAR